MKQFRVSWEMWPHEWPASHRTERIYEDEAEARDHLAGLRGMQANHEARPCDNHVWNIRFEVRESQEWKSALEEPR